MFELSVAFKYLMPRWRQLSVSIISLISILVIALVVWLIVVFFSVTHGLEKSWIQKLIALTAPIRITPTEAYYRSYYYQVDQHSAASNYASKSILEKLNVSQTDPYNPEFDGELPAGMPKPDRDGNGHVKDLVKEVFQVTSSIPQITEASEFEMTMATLSLQMVREAYQDASTISQAIYLGSYDQANNTISESLIPITKDDINLKSRISSSQLLKPFSKLPSEGILLPKSFRKTGILIGDTGYLTYYTPTISSLQEQRFPVYVAGFYDPGIIPIGGKFVLANSETVNLIRSSQSSEENGVSNGINVRFEDLSQADSIKKSLEDAFRKQGISTYWKVETYRDFEFTKDLIQQLRSERNLWSLLATVIIIVACSNIISMLIILVNDKKMEIGILRAMGAKATSIAMVFGICGMIMGMTGSILGMTTAYFTLKNLQSLVNLIGRIQGYEMFNPIFYGNSLPNQISFEAIAFVLITTSLISLLAGLIPAVKASLLKPAAILKAE